MAITRKDVAKYAGVSPATVSNVINNRDIVRLELRNKVLDVIEKLGYQPNMIARSLKTRETKQISLIINNITNQFYAEIALGAIDEAKESGYIICIINASNDEHYFKKLLTSQFDGIIILTNQLTITQINSLAYKNMPIVFIGNEGYVGFDERITQIKLNFYETVYELFNYLIRNNHKRIGFISARVLKDIYSPDYRLEAYMDALKNNNIEFDPSLVFFEIDSHDYAYNSTLKMISYKNKPTTIFAGNDNYSLAVMSAINNSGLKIPDDISVSGFDNLITSKYYLPSLTTIDIPKYSLGQKSVEILLKKIRKETIEDIIIKTELIIRESTGVKK